MKLEVGKKYKTGTSDIVKVVHIINDSEGNFDYPVIAVVDNAIEMFTKEGQFLVGSNEKHDYDIVSELEETPVVTVGSAWEHKRKYLEKYFVVQGVDFKNKKYWLGEFAKSNNQFISSDWLFECEYFKENFTSFTSFALTPPVIAETTQETDIKPIGSLWHYHGLGDNLNSYYQVLGFDQPTKQYIYHCFSKSTNKFKGLFFNNWLDKSLPYTIPEPVKSFDMWLALFGDINPHFATYKSKEDALEYISNDFLFCVHIKITPDAKDINDIIKVIERVEL